MYEDKILDNNFGEVEYRQSPIAIAPGFASRYEESTCEDISALYTERSLREHMQTFFELSPFYEKYLTLPMRNLDENKRVKKVEKGDMQPIYHYFKMKLRECDDNYTLDQIFCAIAEFFDMNYHTLYNDILTISDKLEILEILNNKYGLRNAFKSNSKTLF